MTGYHSSPLVPNKHRVSLERTFWFEVTDKSEMARLHRRDFWFGQFGMEEAKIFWCFQKAKYIGKTFCFPSPQGQCPEATSQGVRWVRWCLEKAELHRKDFPQALQTYGRVPACWC